MCNLWSVSPRVCTLAAVQFTHVHHMNICNCVHKRPCGVRSTRPSNTTCVHSIHIPRPRCLQDYMFIFIINMLYRTTVVEYHVCDRINCSLYGRLLVLSWWLHILLFMVKKIGAWNVCFFRTRVSHKLVPDVVIWMGV
jgi:hypothetical protein